MWFFTILIILVSIALSNITTLPLILIVLLCFSVVFKSPWVFVLAFFTGLYLDIIHVRALGQSSIFFLIFIFSLFLYEKKFEIQSVPFVFFAGILGSLSYLLLSDYKQILEQAIVNSLFAVLLFQFLIRNLKFKMKSKFEN